jgi:hypothetical protein
MKLLLLTFLMTFCFLPLHLKSDEDQSLCQVKTAIEMCFQGSEAGFVAAKTLLEKYKDQPTIQICLKEVMCLCRYSEDIEKDLYTIADDVI